MRIEDYEKFIRQELMRYRSEVEKIVSQRMVSFEEEYIAKNKAAKMIGVTPRTIDRWSIEGYIKRVRVGGRIYFQREEVLRVTQLYNFGIGALATAHLHQPFNKSLLENKEVTESYR